MYKPAQAESVITISPILVLISFLNSGRLTQLRVRSFIITTCPHGDSSWFYYTRASVKLLCLDPNLCARRCP